MPPKQPPPPLNPIETIKQCLTASSCSVSTVSLLADTLRGAPATTTKTAKTTKTTTTKKTVAAKDAGLPILDRSRLAVEVINTTLRALSDAAKSTDPKSEAVPVKAKASTGRAGSKVLQSRSGNSDAATQDPQDAIDYLAECCSASISFLISVENAEGVPTMQPLQTENARLSLLTKLLQLGRFERALEELKQLKRRLQVTMGVAVSADLSGDKASVAKTTGKLSAKTKATGKENGIKNESLSSQDELVMLLEFPDISVSSAAFPLVISFQLAVLRCIAGLKRTESIESLVPAFSSPYNPLACIKTLAKSSAPKALSNVSSLSQIMASLSSLSSLDINTAFALQMIHVESLVFLQQLCPEDKKKSLWSVFEKYLATYIKSFQSEESKSKRDRYIIVRDAVSRMTKQLNPKDDTTLPLEIYKLVSWAASEANIANECMKLTEEWLLALQKVGTDADAALIVLCAVRLAVLDLKILRASQPEKAIPDSSRLDTLEAKIALAVSGLSTISRGRKPDLELLLQESGQLRRYSLSLLTSLPGDGRRIIEALDPVSRANEQRIRRLSDVAFKSVLQFLRKFISMGILPSDQSRISSILHPAIDTILSTLIWGFEPEIQESWNNAEDLLAECSAAAKALEKAIPGYTDTSYEKISNVYYQLCLLYRKVPGAEIQATRALRRSVSIMDDRSPPELQAASVARKYQILGSTYFAARDYPRASHAFLLSLQTVAKTGLLENLSTSIISGEPISRLIAAGDKDTVMLSTVITGLVKICMKPHNVDTSFPSLRFDFDPPLSPSSRGLLLEWSLLLTLDSIEDDGAVVRVVAERLLDIYELEEMPIRRSRVVAELVGLSVDRPEMLNPEVVRGLVEEVWDWATGVQAGDYDEDARMAQWRDDTVASCGVGLGLLIWGEDSGKEMVCRGFQLWEDIVRKAESWEMVREKIEDPQKVIRRLEMAQEFWDMKGETDLRVATLELLLEFRKLEQPVDINALTSTYTRLGLLYLRLGFSGKSGIAILKAQSLISKHPDLITTVTRLEWHLAYTEYLVSIGNLDKGVKYFEEANALAAKDEELAGAKASGAKIAKRVMVNRMVADAAYVTSLIAFEKGNANESLIHARRCVRLNSRAWAGLENLGSRIPGVLPIDPSALPPSSGGPGPQQHTTTHEALNLPLLWPLVSSLHLGYLQTAFIYRHLGMIRESIYFVQQALKTVEAVDAKRTIQRTKLLLADLKIRCGEVEEGGKMLEEIGHIEDARARAVWEVAKGNLERLRGNWEEELEAYKRAEKAVDEVIAQVAGPGVVMNGTEEVTEKLEKLEVTEGRAKTPTRRARTPTRKTTKSPARGKSAAAVAAAAPVPAKATASSVEAECTILLKQKGDIQRLIARAQALRDQTDTAALTLEASSKLPAGNQEVISQGLVEAMNYFQKAFSLVSSDPVFSSLQESTISLPSIALEIARASLAPSPVKPTKGGRKQAVKKTMAFIEVLEQARDCLLRVHGKAMRSGSSTTVPKVASLLTSTIILLSAMTDLKGRGPEHPLFASYSLELQKALSTQREKQVVEAEKLGSILPETLQWPELGSSKNSASSSAYVDATPFEFASFRSEYIDILPRTWAAVSVTMSENKKELYITRFQAGQSQLMVRLPLSRHNNRDEYSDLIEYDAAIKELRDIIEKSNQSTHQAKYMENKKDRATWWTERQQLDDQLRDLLSGIEKGWLGGFKGIFSQYPKNPKLFSRFQSAFDKTLSKLPSRRAGKSKLKKPVDLDPRILELFIALGNPEGQDLDEPLTDLLFFVIDILQFHGEGNAYDEIDLENMILSLTTALAAYHEEASLFPDQATTETDHTILILDKSVQSLPWESLPCLRGRSVSRLPSLAALRSRILHMNPTIPGPQSRPGYYINRHLGGYILNPDNDLTNTLKTFSAPLSSLPGNWTRIISRAPTESEFRDILLTTDLLLYFGHGSGAHYIPAKTIRKLDRCAVACIMGCSSGQLKEAGEFEPYGMVSNYLVAGAPAVLANLWDVTDRDIDRLTEVVFEDWGLHAEGKRGRVNVGKGRSLVEAVAKARDVCTMKYLNGAAPVVYGVPSY
ncbi:peptidase family C50-domain-containing protein, partial [Pyronema omphalodes]